MCQEKSEPDNCNDEELWVCGSYEDEEEEEDDEDYSVPEGAICEYCCEPAEFQTIDGLHLCETHYDDYVDGFSVD